MDTFDSHDPGKGQLFPEPQLDLGFFFLVLALGQHCINFVLAVKNVQHIQRNSTVVVIIYIPSPFAGRRLNIQLDELRVLVVKPVNPNVGAETSDDLLIRLNWICLVCLDGLPIVLAKDPLLELCISIFISTEHSLLMGDLGHGSVPLWHGQGSVLLQHG